MSWLFAVAGLLLVCWFFLRPAKPLYYRGQHQADVPRFIQSLFMLGSPGSVVHLQHEGSPRKLRLRKIPLLADEDGLRLEVPQVPGADLYEAQVQDALTVAGFVCSVPGPLNRLWPAQDSVRVAVDGLSAIEAFRAVEVARAAMGLAQDAQYTMHLEGTPSLSATRKYVRARS